MAAKYVMVLLGAIAVGACVPGDISMDGGSSTDDTGEVCVERWSDLQCWSITNDDIVCAGTYDCASVRVIPPSAMEAAIADGRYVTAGPPTCTNTWSLWESVKCYTIPSAGDIIACTGLLDDVLVPAPDPCFEIPGDPENYLVIDGLHTWPTDPSEYTGLPEVEWPG